jgi:hypothetical protein
MTNITLSPEENQAENSWQFSEVWIDPMLTPPYVLLLLADAENKCYVYDPAKNYQIIFSSNDYKTAKLWLLEDEYEPVEGRFRLDEFL